MLAAEPAESAIHPVQVETHTIHELVSIETETSVSHTIIRSHVPYRLRTGPRLMLRAINSTPETISEIMTAPLAP